MDEKKRKQETEVVKSYYRFGTFVRLDPILRQFPEPLFHTIRLDVFEGFPIYPGGAAIEAYSVPSLDEEIKSPHLVDEGVKAAVGFFLRFRM